jgi:hypothetical protein
MIDVVDHKLIRAFSTSDHVVIPRDIEILGASCFSFLSGITSLSFESNSRLKRSESQAVPAQVAEIKLPSTIEFVAYDASPRGQRLWLYRQDSRGDFDRWCFLLLWNYAVDFRRIQRDQKVVVLDLSFLDEVSMIGKSSQLCRRRDDGAMVVVTTVVPLWWNDIQAEIDNLSNLRHPLITAPIGFALAGRNWKIGRLYAAGGSLAEIISSKPAWWTPTAKAKTVIGIALALRFAHGFGLVHSGLKANNILFDSRGLIQISDFHPIPPSFGGVSGAEPIRWEDVSAFARLLFEIVVGRSWPQPRAPNPKVEVIFPTDAPEFVLKIMKEGVSEYPYGRPSVINIIDSLKQNEYQIMAGVDFDEVAAFVSWVESAEICGEWEEQQ